MSMPMDPELRAGIVALLKAGHDSHDIAVILECSPATVGGVRRAEQIARTPAQLSQVSAGNRSTALAWQRRNESGTPSARAQYQSTIADDIRLMLAADYPTVQIAKECKVSEATVRALRIWEVTPFERGHRDDSALLDGRPWHIAPARVAEQLEAIAASFQDCQQAGPAAVRRAVQALRGLVWDKALPDPLHGELRSAIREWETRSFLDNGLARRLDELSARLEALALAQPAKQRRSA